ncbi:hypothetical protein ACEQUB_p00316 (plasmid) [Ralstonia syzygii]
MKLGVSGASGQLGKAVLAELKAWGATIRLSGSPARRSASRLPRRGGTATTIMPKPLSRRIAGSIAC